MNKFKFLLVAFILVSPIYALEFSSKEELHAYKLKHIKTGLSKEGVEAIYKFADKTGNLENIILSTSIADTLDSEFLVAFYEKHKSELLNESKGTASLYQVESILMVLDKSKESKESKRLYSSLEKDLFSVKVVPLTGWDGIVYNRKGGIQGILANAIALKGNLAKAKQLFKKFKSKNLKIPMMSTILTYEPKNNEHEKYIEWCVDVSNDITDSNFLKRMVRRLAVLKSQN